MKKIAVITATRAEFGLLSPVIRELRKSESEDLKIELIVTGTHLSDQYGMTINEIIESGIRIDHRIEVPIESKTPVDISMDQAEVLVKFTKLFEKEKYNAIIILGDRYEMLPVAISAGNTHTPVFHLCGGDTTEGAIDEWIRHSITKMSYLHFVTNEDSRKRVIQLGESPDRVFNYGSTSIDNIISIADIEKLDALSSIGMTDCKYALCTYHPVTMDEDEVDDKIAAFLEVIQAFPDIQFIVTKSNADQGGRRINELLDKSEPLIENLHVFSSLGARRYLSLMKSAEFILGNSSSGIIEAPALHVPTVNIGDRQRGRLQAESIINCTEDSDSICVAIKMAMSQEHRRICNSVISPYGDGHAAANIARKCVETVCQGQINLKKSFYNL
jgi:GDP/UDP-N,N'-diacetylbacillosamine 2-epimerase (hydrolysing)